METPAARRQLRAANAETAELAGTKTLKILVMVNTKKTSHVKEAISPKPSTDGGGRAPAYVWFFHDHKWKQRYDPSAKLKVTSPKHHAPVFRKRQASSHKHQASSAKRQASQPE
jgi:hypothetical protein